MNLIIRYGYILTEFLKIKYNSGKNKKVLLFNMCVIYVNNEGKLHIRGERGSTCEMSILYSG